MAERMVLLPFNERLEALYKRDYGVLRDPESGERITISRSVNKTCGDINWRFALDGVEYYIKGHVGLIYVRTRQFAGPLQQRLNQLHPNEVVISFSDVPNNFEQEFFDQAEIVIKKLEDRFPNAVAA